MISVKVKILLLIGLWLMNSSAVVVEGPALNARDAFHSFVESFYDCVKEENISFAALENGLKGYHYLRKNSKLKKKRYLTIVDFSLPSNLERLFVIDLEENKVVHRSLVAHGMNSGDIDATAFSNEHDSHKSSLGFYITGRVYRGKHAESIKLYGIERNFNSNAYNRGVVVHRADYATEDFLKMNNGVLGRSFGCPAVPAKHYKELTQFLRDGSCFYIYHPNKYYHRNSKILTSQQGLNNFLEYYNS